MIYIHKQKEPQKLLAYRKTEFADYDNMPTEVKDAVRDSLMEEQGNICAYCMRRLEKDKTTIEHIIPRNPKEQVKDTKLSLDYKNMLAVCDGNKGAPFSQTTCDKHKGNKSLTITPLDPRMISQIEYKQNGVIYSNDAEIQKDLNITLNLNCSAVSLPECRKNALDGLKGQLQQEKKRGNWTKEMLQKYKRKIEEKKNGSYDSYLGILLWYLDNKIKRVHK